LLKDVNLTYSDNTYDIFTHYADHLFEGSDIVILGKYKLGTNRIEFKGTAVSKNGNETIGHLAHAEQHHDPITATPMTSGFNETS
jgi:hypothetical protein